MASTAESTATSGGPPIDTFSGPAFGFLANHYESSVRGFCPGRDETYVHGRRSACRVRSFRTSFAEFPTAASAINAMREGLDPDVWKKCRLKIVITVLRDKFARCVPPCPSLVSIGTECFLGIRSWLMSWSLQASGVCSSTAVPTTPKLSNAKVYLRTKELSGDAVETPVPSEGEEQLHMDLARLDGVSVQPEPARPHAFYYPDRHTRLAGHSTLAMAPRCYERGQARLL